jgi:predicted DsbA family dithiol-disulfide isomerase
MMEVRCHTDPACPWSWAMEPVIRRLMVVFGDGLQWRFVMGGLHRELGPEDRARLTTAWLKVADATAAPLDPLIWDEGPLRSTYPACMAVEAAAEQAADGGYAYLRRLREGIMCFRRKLDHSEALVEEARHAGLDVERFRIDLSSHGTTEAFAADLDRAAALAPETAAATAPGSRTTAGALLPTLVFGTGDERRLLAGLHAYADCHAAVVAMGADPVTGSPPSPAEVVARFGTVTTLEVQEICDVARPRAASELWQLAAEWRVRRRRVLTGDLWERSER